MKKLIVIEGPTASGKTDTAVRVAQALCTEIVNADSRQIFREMRIGTAVPDAETLSKVPHHLMQNHSVTDSYNAFVFEEEAISAIRKIHENHDVAVMCGGSMMYVDAVCNGIDSAPDPDPEIRKMLWDMFYEGEIDRLRIMLLGLDPQYYSKCDLDNHTRIIHALEMCLTTGKPFSSFMKGKRKERDFAILRIGLNMDRDILHDRINRRVDIMMREGLLDEVKSLVQYRNLMPLNTVGYRELFDYLDGKTDLPTAIELIKRNTRRYARKQITWFGKELGGVWHNPFDFDEIMRTVNNKFYNQPILIESPLGAIRG